MFFMCIIEISFTPLVSNRMLVWNIWPESQMAETFLSVLCFSRILKWCSPTGKCCTKHYPSFATQAVTGQWSSQFVLLNTIVQTSFLYPVPIFVLFATYRNIVITGCSELGTGAGCALPLPQHSWNRLSRTRRGKIGQRWMDIRREGQMSWKMILSCFKIRLLYHFGLDWVISGFFINLTTQRWSRP